MPNGSGQWLMALAADAAVQIDFVGYHPYYNGIKQGWGYHEDITDGLRDYKKVLNQSSTGIRSITNQYGAWNTCL